MYTMMRSVRYGLSSLAGLEHIKQMRITIAAPQTGGVLWEFILDDPFDRLGLKTTFAEDNATTNQNKCKDRKCSPSCPNLSQAVLPKVVRSCLKLIQTCLKQTYLYSKLFVVVFSLSEVVPSYLNLSKAVLSIVVQSCPKLSKAVRSCPKLSKVVQSCLKLSQTCPKQTNLYSRLFVVVFSLSEVVPSYLNLSKVVLSIVVQSCLKLFQTYQKQIYLYSRLFVVVFSLSEVVPSYLNLSKAVLSIVVRSCPKLSEAVQSCPNLSEVVQSCLKLSQSWSKAIQFVFQLV